MCNIYVVLMTSHGLAFESFNGHASFDASVSVVHRMSNSLFMESLMGSFQQISLGVVCLVAAFAFGTYVNYHPADVQHPLAQNASDDLAVQPVGNVQSRLTDGQFDVINRRPAPIATMRNPLKPRFPMPVDAQVSVVPRVESKLPPPSQLANQDPPKPSESRPWPTPKNHEPSNSGEHSDVPDFSAIAREFKNNPIELPTLGLMPSVGSMPSHVPPISTVTTPPAPVAPLKKLAHRTHRVGANTLNPATAPHPSTADVRRNWKASPSFSADDFAPQLNGQFVAPPIPPEIASNSDSNIVPAEHLARIPSYSNPASSNPASSGVATFKPPIEPAHSNHVISKQAAPNDVYRGSLTTAPGEELDDSRSSNRVRTMLPFGLTDEAKSRLVAIRSDASSRISLNTTKFVDHVVKRGETLQSISIRYFGNPDYYLDIYLANRNKLRNPVDVREGIFLRIPVYE
jgi:hypothetical protein